MLYDIPRTSAARKHHDIARHGQNDRACKSVSVSSNGGGLMIRTVTLLLCALVLGSCSYLSAWSPLSATPSYGNRQRPSGSEDQTAADLASCRQQASAIIQRDAAIDQDIASARKPLTVEDGLNDVLANMDVYGREQRYNRITKACMRQRGYVLPEKSMFEPGSSR